MKFLIFCFAEIEFVRTLQRMQQYYWQRLGSLCYTLKAKFYTDHLSIMGVHFCESCPELCPLALALALALGAWGSGGPIFEGGWIYLAVYARSSYLHITITGTFVQLYKRCTLRILTLFAHKTKSMKAPIKISTYCFTTFYLCEEI